METVAFYSYKGGVGRTLLVSNTATFLAMSGWRVVALDFDLEAPGLHYKLGRADALDRAQAGELRGTVDLLLEMVTGDAAGVTLGDAAVKLDLTDSTGRGALMMLPAGAAPSRRYWNTLEKLHAAVRSPRREGGLLEAALELQARIAEEWQPDFLLIDSRTGITELGGLATSVLADRVVCLTTMSPESVEGTRVVADALRSAPRLDSKAPLRVEFLLTRVPVGYTDSAPVKKLLQELGGEGTVFPHEAGIAREERVYSGARDGAAEDDGLEAATLAWIRSGFPGREGEAAEAVKRWAAVTMRKIAEVLQALGELDSAIAVLETEVIPDLKALGAEGDLASARWVLANWLPQRGGAEDLQQVEALIEQAYQAARRIGLPLAREIERFREQGRRRSP